jgi:acetyltransferase-like isoleucine patch superfamily enzyme
VGASIAPGRSIGDDTIIGAGAAVIRDVPAKVTVGGTPAKNLEKTL